ncbi:MULTISPECIES: hypothetical protein [unclassified Streptomyces]|uniref:hypothetical protein n=1 Tax=unclassified Streptomyces TaxID=2593676 RepID=UPI0033B149D9
MSVICAQEPDGEIALGIQLKHAARRILANPTTHSYAAPDGAWMREFDDRLATAAAADLIHTELPELHFGNLNHCLWQPEWAECTKHLSQNEGGAPLIGACQPARCRNSAVTPDHAPIWLAEQLHLTQQLRDRRPLVRRLHPGPGRPLRLVGRAAEPVRGGC